MVHATRRDDGFKCQKCDCKLVDKLNTVLETASRPDFLGPISVVEFDAGDEAPELEIVGIQDIWPEFLSVDHQDELDRQPVEPPVRTVPVAAQGIPKGDSSSAVKGNGEAQRSTQSHAGFENTAGGGGPPLRSPSSSQAQSVRGISTSVASAGLGPAGIFSHWQNRHAQGARHPVMSPIHAGFSVSHPSVGLPPPPYPYGPRSTAPPTRNASFSSKAPISPHPLMQQLHEDISSVPPIASEVPSLQIKAHVRWQTTSVRMTLKTSVLINQPCYMFMELPLVVTLTGAVLDGTLLLALEGASRRLHMTLLDDDPEKLGTTANNDDRERAPAAPVILTASTSRPKSQQAASLPSFGTRLLPFLTFESSVGEESKHALRNVGKVEKFISELIRKIIEDELAFPNFYTIEMPN